MEGNSPSKPDGVRSSSFAATILAADQIGRRNAKVNNQNRVDRDQTSEGDGFFVCDKSIQVTPHDTAWTSESQTAPATMASPPTRRSFRPPPDASPASANAAMALSRLFHQPPPPPYPAHQQYQSHPRSFSWGSPPPARPPPYYPPEQNSEWREQYPRDPNSSNSFGNSSETGSTFESSYSASYPSPAHEAASHQHAHYYPPHAAAVAPHHHYPQYSPNKRHASHHLVTPTPKKLRSCSPLDTLSSVASINNNLTNNSNNNEEYSRKNKSLGLLCENFCKHDWSLGIGIDEAAKTLGVERRRIYDIINILESIEVVRRKCKNRYAWLGFGRLPNTLGDIQFEGMAQGLAKEAISLGILLEGETIPEQEPESPQVKKSLGKLSRQFLQLFLIGNTTLSLIEASDRIMGKADEPTGIKDPTKFKAALSKGQKTKIRRLYDIANVLASVGLVRKKEGEKRSRPTFSWVYHWTPKQIRVLVTDGMPPATHTAESSPASNKDVLARIHEHGAREPAQDRSNSTVLGMACHRPSSREDS